MDNDYYQDEPIKPKKKAKADSDKKPAKHKGGGSLSSASLSKAMEVLINSPLWDLVSPGGHTKRAPKRKPSPFTLKAVQPPPPEIDDDTPQLLKTYFLRRNVDEDDIPKSSTQKFLADGLLLKDLTDSAPVCYFKNISPTYRDMSLAQLRSYFTFRANFRRGNYLEVPLSYVQVYIYEVLMLIGIANAEEGYQILKEIDRAYSRCYDEYTFLYHLKSWTKDFVAYYGLREHVNEVFYSEIKDDSIVSRCLDMRKLSNKDLWQLIEDVGAYDFSQCQKRIQDDKLMKRIVCLTLKAIDADYVKCEGRSLAERFLGEIYTEFYPIFFPAVFCCDLRVSYSFAIDNVRRYKCQNGRWYMERYSADLRRIKQELFRVYLHEIDRLMRLRLTGSSTLKPLGKTPLDDNEISIIETCIHKEQVKIEAAKRAAEQKTLLQRVAIDPGKLSAIRSDAAATREQLLNDEERGLMEVVATSPADGKKKASPQPAVKPAASEVNDSTQVSSSLQAPAALPAAAPSAGLLSPDELQFLQLLLSAGDWRAFLQQKHLILSVVMEAVNDKLLETFGDVVLQDNDGKPEVIEDYREELTRLIPSSPAKSSRPRKKSKRGE